MAALKCQIFQRHRLKLPLQREISAPSTKVDLPDSKISPCHLPQLPFQTMRDMSTPSTKVDLLDSELFPRHQLKLLANAELFTQVMNKISNVRIR